MNYASNPVEDLASSLYRALSVDLSDVEYEGFDYGDKSIAEMKASGKPMSEWPRVAKLRRPRHDDLRRVLLFQETWGSTALGFGGIGGAAMSTANTVVITCGLETAVYWSGRCGYIVKANGASAELEERLRKGVTPCRRDALKLFGANVRLPVERG